MSKFFTVHLGSAFRNQYRLLYTFTCFFWPDSC